MELIVQKFTIYNKKYFTYFFVVRLLYYKKRIIKYITGRFVMLYVLLIVAVIISLSLAYINYRKVSKLDAGTDQMKIIAGYIQSGAREFLNQEWKLLYIVGAMLFVIIYLLVSWSAAVCFVIGASMSGLAGFVGMTMATKANVRVTNTARLTRDKGKTLKVAFTGGTVMGLSVGGFALLGLLAVYLIFGKAMGQLGVDSLVFRNNQLGIADIPFTMSVSAYALGCSIIAMFNRVGGGIYTKAADMGADLVGKAEEGIPEDDARNPATIADNVGDNVGDVAGLGSDLLESYVGAISSAIILAIYTYYSVHGTAHAISYDSLLSLVSYPLIFCAIGLISSSISIIVFLIKKESKNLSRSLNGITYLAAALTIVFNFIITPYVFKEPISAFQYGSLSPWFCAILGIISGIGIGSIAEYYTSYSRSPTLKLADSSNEGAAIVITNGLGLGMNSTLPPVAIIALTIILSNASAGLYGVGMAAMGMLSFVAATVSVDTYGPIADNSGGIAEMCGLDPEVRAITDELDAIGNTTAAIGKGFAIGSAALAALSLFASYLYAVAGANSGTFELVLNMIDTLTLAGALVGAALPYLFSGLLIDAVSNTAKKMVDEVRQQFKLDPGILLGTSTPKYNQCISISCKGALSAMVKPAVISIATPLLAGFIFGPRFVGGLLIGTTLSAVMLAIFTANSGGAWDNAKKYIEMGHHGGSGSPSYIASIVGDTVGDPLKDTVGPSLDILIKIMSVISLIMVSIYSEYNLISYLF
jgi:K(+)-stimulated pyrophosphate-energized sodium pump